MSTYSASESNLTFTQASNKFFPTGAAQPFPGNTILCHLPIDCPLRPRLDTLIVALNVHPLSSYFIQLSPVSWHMTVVGGVCDAVRDFERWPPGKNSQSLQECTDEFAMLFQDRNVVDLEEEGLASPYKLQVQGFQWFGAAMTIIVAGATRDEEMRLRRLKDRLAKVMGFRHPGHETYSWHISVAYLSRSLNKEQMEQLDMFLAANLEQLQVEFELGTPEFCSFQDVTSFQHLFYI